MFFLQCQGSGLFTVIQIVSPHWSFDDASVVPVPVSALMGLSLGNSSHPVCELLWIESLKATSFLRYTQGP